MVNSACADDWSAEIAIIASNDKTNFDLPGIYLREMKNWNKNHT